jgi:SAM-dependent methyltransferase
MTEQAIPKRAGWYQRLFAWGMARSSTAHSALVAEHKRALLSSLQGDVLEIGPGTGPNLAYYAPGIRWIGVEPNPHMHPYLRREAERLGLTVDLRTGTAERLIAADASVDAVVSTLVLCSVADLPGTLREIRRVLRPGGPFVFIEHVAARCGGGKV